MKKFLLAFSLALAAAPAFAQTAASSSATSQQQTTMTQRQTGERMSPEQRANMYTNELKTKLDLTPDQLQKVLAVNTECIRRKDALKAGGAQGRGGMREIADYRRQQFAAILTPAQSDKLKAMNAERRGQMGNDNNHTMNAAPAGNQ